MSTEWSAAFLRSVIDAAPEGIVICAVGAGEHPVVYANAAFERLSGYSLAELLGTDMRRMQGTDREQEGRTRLRQALQRGESARALLRNYRKDGTQFWNEIFMQPVRDGAGVITHFVGFHRDIGERERASGARAAAGLPVWMREDRLTGLYTRAYFEELLQHDWLSGQREGRPLTLLMFDFDALGAYNDTFGRPAGDACIRRLAGVINAAFRRGADVVARWEGGTLCALARTTDPTAVAGFAQAIAQKVFDQHIRHPRAMGEKYVTISAGVATLKPGPGLKPELLLQAASRALKRARTGGPGRVEIASEADLA
jgi:diguanylate cyclase (GGDEF)-like protein/PAS domain S-box-containing protein